jgi:chemotaxis protein MotB
MSAKMRKRNSTENGADMDTTLWMVTFGDLLMLLLTFFVLLLSMSSMDMKALKDMFSIFGGAIGPLELCDEKPVTARDIVHKGAGGHMELSDLDTISALKNHYRQIMEKRKNIPPTNNLDVSEEILAMEADTEHSELIESLKEVVGISEDERGVIITLQEMVLFDSGRADIKPNIFPLLDCIAEVLDPIPNDVLIMGHTDNVPTRSDRYRSNWELSLYRALNVHSYFIEKKSLSPERFAVGGYGDLRPRFPNDTREGRQKNRRVEIIIKKN